MKTRSGMGDAFVDLRRDAAYVESKRRYDAMKAIQRRLGRLPSPSHKMSMAEDAVFEAWVSFPSTLTLSEFASGEWGAA
jgi:hypothetical protein